MIFHLSPSLRAAFWRSNPLRNDQPSPGNLRFLTACLLLLLSTTLYASSEDNYPFTSSQAAARFQSLISETRCVVCQNQNIADSNAPLAKDLRGKIYHMVIANQSDEEIKNYLVNRYGEFILFQPRFNKFTVMLWIFPILSLLFAFMIFYRLSQKAKS